MQVAKQKQEQISVLTECLWKIAAKMEALRGTRPASMVRQFSVDTRLIGKPDQLPGRKKLARLPQLTELLKIAENTEDAVSNVVVSYDGKDDSTTLYTTSSSRCAEGHHSRGWSAA